MDYAKLLNKLAKMDKFWLMDHANAHMVKASLMDTVKLHQRHQNVSQLKSSLMQDHAHAIKDSPSPTLVQVVYNKQLTASLDKPSPMVVAHAQLDKQSSHMVLDVKLQTHHASQLKA